MSKTAKIVILLIVVIAVGWGIGKYTALRFPGERDQYKHRYRSGSRGAGCSA